MKLIIEMDDKDYNRIKDIPNAFNSLTSRAYIAIKNGTPLPKGHWIDINGDKSLWKCSHCGQHSCCNGNFCIDCGADMREADKEV